MKLPIISVIMPAFNAEEYLSEAIESILKQTFKDFEFLIIDDGSTDKTNNIIKSYSDNRIYLIQNKENIGLVASLNIGIREARGKYIARMDADDISEPYRFQLQIDNLQKYQSDICGGNFTVIDRNGKEIRKRRVPLNKECIVSCLASTVPFAHGSVMMRREFLNTKNLTYGPDRYAEDYDLWIRIYENGGKITNVNEFIFKYRIHKFSLSKILKYEYKKSSYKLRFNYINKNRDECSIALRKINSEYNKNNYVDILNTVYMSFLMWYQKGNFLDFWKFFNICNMLIKMHLIYRIVYFYHDLIILNFNKTYKHEIFNRDWFIFLKFKNLLTRKYKNKYDIKIESELLAPEKKSQIKVKYFHRKPDIGNYSLEGYFNSIREVLSSKIDCKIHISKYKSNGIFRRIFNILEAGINQGQINHITGDIHFICYFMKKRNTLLTILDCGFINHSFGIKKLLLHFFWYIIPVSRVSRIVTISESTKNELLRCVKCDPSKISVIPVCISNIFTYTDYVFNENKPIILQVGTSVNKNLLRLFEAIKDISCKLVIIGELSHEQLKSLKFFNIDFENSKDLSEDDIFLKYKNCDLVSFVSTYEGFGMPILEANAVGRPVITSNILSMPEVAGNAAHMVNPYKTLEIRNGILKIIQDKEYRNLLIQNGINNAKKYNNKNISNEYLKIYEQIYNN